MRLIPPNLFILISIGFTSCVGSKYLKSNEELLVKQSITEAKGLSYEGLADSYQQKPNTRILGLPLSPGVFIYQWGKNNYDSTKYLNQLKAAEEKYDAKIAKARKANRKIKFEAAKNKKIALINKKLKEGNWRMRRGESLAVYDSGLASKTVENMEKYLFTRGYFDAEVNVITANPKPNLIEVEYKIDRQKRYKFDSILYVIPDPSLDSLIKGSKSELRKGSSYTQAKLTNERERIFQLLSDRGYYEFAKQYVYFEVDTVTLDANKIFLKVFVANPPNQDSHKRFKVGSVIFVSDANVRTTIERTPSFYKGIIYQFGRSKYSRKLLNYRLFIRPDSLYSRTKTLDTQRQLVNLDAFRFVNVNYDTLGTELIANIFTSPLDKYQTSNEIGISSTEGFPGPFFNFSLKNRNVFRGLEILEFKGNMNLQGIGRVIEDEEGNPLNADNTNYSLLQIGGQISLTFPQFLFPLSENLRQRISRYNPSTSLSFSYNFENRIGNFNRQIISAAVSYKWQVRNNISYNLVPFSLGFVRSDLDPVFQDFLDDLRESGNGSYPASFESAVLNTSSIDAVINFGEYGNNRETSALLRLFLESGGNLLNALGTKVFNFDSVDYQYMKFRVDYRNHFVLTRRSAIATRLHIGIAFPYGPNPPSLPYEKYFYVGGSNSIRAWPARRLGPGGFGVIGVLDSTQTNEQILQSTNPIIYTLEQGGDMIIESSIEWRKKLTSYLSTAVFVDAGNIWQIRSNTITPQSQALLSGNDGQFRFSTFYKEIAVGAGVGLRIDLSYLIFRVDLATQVVDPAQQPGSRFVLDDIKFNNLFSSPPEDASDERIRSGELFRTKTRINFGIGFPF